MRRFYAFACLAWLSINPLPAAACGSDTPCPIATGQYYVALPPDPEPKTGTVVYLHGYAATGKAALANAALTAPLLAAGYAVIAPDGQVDKLQGHHLDWGVDDGGGMERDDTAFLRDVIADAAARFDLAGRPALLMGYSRGGSMVWDIACTAPDLAEAYTSHAGAFWTPLPDRCAGPVRLLHSHGFTDTTLPFEGTTMMWFGHSFEMGSVSDGLSIWTRSMGCGAKADRSVAADGIWQKDWRHCDAGGQITLQLVPSGHGRRGDWSAAALAWLGDAP